MPYGVRDVLKHLAKMAEKANRINIWSKRKFRHLEFPIGSHNKEKIHPRVAFHVERVEKVVGANVFIHEDVPHIQHYRSPQGVSVVALPPDAFYEMIEQGEFSLHGNLTRILVERGLEVPTEEEWIEAHRRTLQLLIQHRDNAFARRAAHEYLSHVILGAAAYELLGGKALVPEELRSHVEAYKQALKPYGKDAWENVVTYYLHFLEAAKRLGFHRY